MHFVASELKDKSDHNMASIRHSHAGAVVGELSFHVMDFYTIEKDTGTSVAAMCTQVKDFTFEWSNNWHFFVPGCDKGSNLGNALEADGDWDLVAKKDDLTDADTKKVHTCYESVRNYTRNATGQKFVWGICVIVYALLIASNLTAMRKKNLTIMLVVFLVVMICQGLQYNFLQKVGKDGCFEDRIAKVMEIVKVHDSTTDNRAVKAYDWFGDKNMHKYLRGKSFVDSDVPSITEKDPSKIGTYSPNAAMLWTNIGLSIVGAILIIYDFVQDDSDGKLFTQSFMM